MHRPRTVNTWEARSALRWGSQHAGWFKSEDEARAHAEKEIAAAGNVGRIGSVIPHATGGTLYYDIYEEMS